MIEHLESNVLRARKKAGNFELVYLAILGEHIKDKETVGLSHLRANHLKMASFLAEAFENEIEAIWHLEDVAVGRLYRLKQTTLNQVAKAVLEKGKRKQDEEADDEREAKKRKTEKEEQVDEAKRWETTDDFDDWMTKFGREVEMEKGESSKTEDKEEKAPVSKYFDDDDDWRTGAFEKEGELTGPNWLDQWDLNLE